MFIIIVFPLLPISFFQIKRVLHVLLFRLLLPLLFRPLPLEYIFIPSIFQVFVIICRPLLTAGGGRVREKVLSATLELDARPAMPPWSSQAALATLELEAAGRLHKVWRGMRP